MTGASSARLPAMLRALAFLLIVLTGKLSNAMNLNDRFHQMTTMIKAEAHGHFSQGSGFFYAGLAPKEGEGAEWRRVEELWVATNRHVLLPTINEKETVPEKITLYLRQINSHGHLEWLPTVLGKSHIESNTRFHSDRSVDVALINVYDQFISRLDHGHKMATPTILHAEQQIGYNNITAEVGDDVLVAGYPRGFYDDVNLFPIVKAGIIASRWGAPFRGQPYFLIDAKLFPGSSGSVVVSKPINMTIKDGRLMRSDEKQFALLGIFSGEYVGYNLGIVWYAEAIEEARQQGVTIHDAISE